MPEEIFRGRVFRVTREPVRRADGRTGHYEVVRHLGAVAVLPLLLDPLRVLLLEQYRHPVGGAIWEIPAGTLDVRGESAEACARRELIEETGFQAGRLRHLHDFYTAPGFCDERLTLYVAWELSPATAEQDSDEQIVVHELGWERLQEMLGSGQVQDAKTLIGLRWLESALAGPGGLEQLIREDG